MQVGKVQVGKVLCEHDGFVKLIALVTLHCGDFEAQAVGNVLNGLAVLQTDLGVKSVDDKVALQLVCVVESTARTMNAQGIAVTLNAMCKLEAVAGVMSPSGWDAVARAVESTAWDAQDAGLTLNALRKLEAAAGAMSPSGRGRVSGDDRSSGMGGGRGGSRGRGGGTDSSRGGGRGGDFAKLLPLLTDAEYPEDILIIVRPYMDEVESPQLLNHKEVARAFQMLGRLAKWEHQGPLYLLSSRTFRALLRIAKDFADSGKFNRTTIMVAVAGITDLHVKHQVRAGNTVVDDTLSALEAALGRL
mmetsp:Transcript_19628/g.31776  ORF Transcript_19628/g.31776 Transcript_19628/m.31776 type:complete len:303 (-) Transcript_19628:1284-2192(-)